MTTSGHAELVVAGGGDVARPRGPRRSRCTRRRRRAAAGRAAAGPGRPSVARASASSGPVAWSQPAGGLPLPGRPRRRGRPGPGTGRSRRTSSGPTVRRARRTRAGTNGPSPPSAAWRSTDSGVSRSARTSRQTGTTPWSAASATNSSGSVHGRRRSRWRLLGGGSVGPERRRRRGRRRGVGGPPETRRPKQERSPVWQAPRPCWSTSTSRVSPSQSTRRSTTRWVSPDVAPLCHSSPRERDQKTVSPRLDGARQRGAVHPGDHQHLAGVVLLDDGGHEAPVVERRRRRGRARRGSGVARVTRRRYRRGRASLPRGGLPSGRRPPDPRPPRAATVSSPAAWHPDPTGAPRAPVVGRRAVDRARRRRRRGLHRSAPPAAPASATTRPRTPGRAPDPSTGRRSATRPISPTRTPRTRRAPRSRPQPSAPSSCGPAGLGSGTRQAARRHPAAPRRQPVVGGATRRPTDAGLEPARRALGRHLSLPLLIGPGRRAMGIAALVLGILAMLSALSLGGALAGASRSCSASSPSRRSSSGWRWTRTGHRRHRHRRRRDRLRIIAWPFRPVLHHRRGLHRGDRQRGRVPGASRARAPGPVPRLTRSAAVRPCSVCGAARAGRAAAPAAR